MGKKNYEEFKNKTPREVIDESGLKSYWLGVLVKNEELYGVKIKARRTIRSYWYFDIFSEAKIIKSIPCPAIEDSGLTNIQCVEVLLKLMRTFDSSGAWNARDIGLRHEISTSRRTGASSKLARKKIGTPWMKINHDISLEIIRIKRVRNKSASQKRELAALEVRLKANPTRWLVGMGVGYRMSRNKIVRGFRIKMTNFEKKMVLVESVVDAGELKSLDSIHSPLEKWVFIDALVRDKKFDSSDGFGLKMTLET